MKKNQVGLVLPCNGSWSDLKNKILPKRCSRIWYATCKKCFMCNTLLQDFSHSSVLQEHSVKFEISC